MSFLPNLDIQRTIEQKAQEVLQNPKEQLNDLINGRTERKETTQSTESTRSLEGATKIPYGGAAELGGHKFAVHNGRPFMNDVDMNGGPFGPNEAREVTKDGYVAFAKDKDWYVVQEGKTPTAAPSTDIREVKPGESFRVNYGEKVKLGMYTIAAEADKWTGAGINDSGHIQNINFAGAAYKPHNDGKGWVFTAIKDASTTSTPSVAAPNKPSAQPYTATGPVPGTNGMVQNNAGGVIGEITYSGSAQGVSTDQKVAPGQAEYRIPFGQTLQIGGAVIQSTKDALFANGANTSERTLAFPKTGHSYLSVKENDGWTLIRTDAAQTAISSTPNQELKPQGQTTPVEPPMGYKPVPTPPPEAPQPKKEEGHKLEEGKPYTLNGLKYELKGGQLLIAGQATQLKEATNEVVIPGDKQKGTPDKLVGYVVKGPDGSITIYDPTKVAAKPAPANEPSSDKPAHDQPIARTTGIPWEEYFKGEASLGKGPVHEMMKYAEANPEKFMAALAETQKHSGSLSPRLQLLMTYTELSVWSKLDKK